MVTHNKALPGRKKTALSTFKKELIFHLMTLPSIVFVIIFNYIPMAGIIIAFQKFVPARGLFGDQTFVGLENFAYLFKLPNFVQIIKNTIVISFFKSMLGLLVPITVAIMLNEVKIKLFKGTVQTLIYLPYFISWVVVASMMIDILSPNAGLVNGILNRFGIESIYFLGDEKLFPYVMVLSDTWKNFGYGSIIYLAAITGIDLTLYEAAKIDGASKWQQIWHITLPGMRMIITLMALLGLGNILNGGFEQIFNLLNNQVLRTGEILDTYIYKLAFGISTNYSLSAAAGLFKSVISTILISLAYYCSYKFADYRMF